VGWLFSIEKISYIVSIFFDVTAAMAA